MRYILAVALCCIMSSVVLSQEDSSRADIKKQLNDLYDGQYQIGDSVLIRKLDGIRFRARRIYKNSEVSLSRSQFLTMAGALEDPSRLLIKFAGISTGNDQANSIVYRGIPAQYHRWSLYGGRVLNPNHLSNAGTISDLPSRSAGGVNMLSGQVIGSLDFYGGPNAHALDALGASSDIRLRKPYRNQLSTNLSLIGLEAGLDRVYNGGKSGLMINYRYSTVGLLTSMGLDFGGEAINYQDITASYGIKGKDDEWNFYLSMGNNSNKKEAIPSDSIPETNKDLQDIEYTSGALLGGINYSKKTLDWTNYFSKEFTSTINLSVRDTDRSASRNNNSIGDYSNSEILVSLHQNYNKKKGLQKLARWSLGYTLDSYFHKVDLSNRILIGPEGTYLSTLAADLSTFHVIPTFDIGYLLPYDWFLTSNLGVQSVFGDDSEVSFVGNIEANYELWGLTGKVAVSRSSQIYEPELSLYTEDRDFIKSTNFEMQTEYKGVGASAFYHRLSDVPYAADLVGFSGIGQLDYLPVIANSTKINMNTDGEGDVYGASIFVQKTLTGINVHSNLTVTKSNYKARETESDLPLDYGHIFNVSLNKKWRTKKNKVFGLSGSFHHRGGANQNIVDVENSSDRGYTNYSHENQFSLQLEDYYRADLRLYYSPSTSSTISLDIQNVTNRENDGYYYYEPVTGKSTLKKQLGMIPILSWRKYW